MLTLGAASACPNLPPSNVSCHIYIAIAKPLPGVCSVWLLALGRRVYGGDQAGAAWLQNNDVPYLEANGKPVAEADAKADAEAEALHPVLFHTARRTSDVVDFSSRIRRMGWQQAQWQETWNVKSSLQ